jgi:hypothetical protein
MLILLNYFFKLGDFMRPEVAFKRKHRWTIATSGFAGYEDSSERFVKVESSDIPLERFAVCSEKSFLTITTYECQHNDSLVALAAAAYDESQPKGNLILKMYDGCGNLIDKWDLSGCVVNGTELFDLDMETTSLKMTFAYDKAEHTSVMQVPADRPKMGLGRLGQTTYMHKRNRHRWVLEADFGGLKAGPMFVRVHCRPTLDIQEIEKDDGTKEYNSKWQDFKFTIDATDQIEMAQTLWPIIAKTYQFAEVDPVANEEQPPKEPLKGTIVIKLVDGVGTVMEAWTISDAYFTNIDFGELDFQSNDAELIECKVRFANVAYNHPSLPQPTVDNGVVASPEAESPRVTGDLPSA